MITATQSRLHLERMERERRLAARAVPDRDMVLARPPPGVTGYEFTLRRQQERQRRIAEHKQLTAEQTLEHWLANFRNDVVVKYVLVPCEKTVALDTITVTDVQNVFCRVAQITRLELLTERRTADVVGNRQLCMMLCKALTIKSLPEIGRRFSRDHTTVINAIRKMKPVEDAVRAQLPIDATLLQWVSEALIVFHALPKGALKGRGVRSV